MKAGMKYHYNLATLEIFHLNTISLLIIKPCFHLWFAKIMNFITCMHDLLDLGYSCVHFYYLIFVVV